MRASETDFNNMTRSGYFFGKFVQNTPDGTTDSNWIVEVQAFDNSTGWTFQRATRSSDKAIFTRIQDNGTWSDWEVLAKKSDFPNYFKFLRIDADPSSYDTEVLEHISSLNNTGFIIYCEHSSVSMYMGFIVGNGKYGTVLRFEYDSLYVNGCSGTAWTGWTKLR